MMYSGQHLALPALFAIVLWARAGVSSDILPCRTTPHLVHTTLTLAKVAPETVDASDLADHVARCLGLEPCQISTSSMYMCGTQQVSAASVDPEPALESSAGFGGCSTVRNCSSILVDKEVFDTVADQDCMPEETDDGGAVVVCAGVVVPQATLKAIWCNTCHSNEACHTCDSSDTCASIHNCDRERRKARRHLLADVGSIDCHKLQLTIQAESGQGASTLRETLSSREVLTSLQQCITGVAAVTAVGPTVVYGIAKP